MKNPDVLRILFPDFLGENINRLKNITVDDYFVKMAQRPSEYGNIEIISW